MFTALQFESRKFKVRVFGFRIPFTIGATRQAEYANKLVDKGLSEAQALIAVSEALEWLDRIL